MFVVSDETRSRCPFIEALTQAGFGCYVIVRAGDRKRTTGSGHDARKGVPLMGGGDTPAVRSEGRDCSFDPLVLSFKLQCYRNKH